MEIAFILTQTSSGSAGSFVKTHQICKNLKIFNFNPTILCPFDEDLDKIKDVNIELIPTLVSKLGLSNLSYKIARKMASNNLTSGLFLSERSIEKMISTLEKGLNEILNKKKFDMIYAVQPIASLASVTFAHEKNIPLITELNNIWPEEAIISGQIVRDDETFSRLKSIEQRVIDESDGIVVVSEFMKKYIFENYSVGNKPFAIQTSVGPILEKSEKPRQNNVVYAGMVNPRAHVDLFIKSIPFVKNINASFHISNKGDEIGNLKKLSNNFTQKINYFWKSSWNDALCFLQESKIGILPTTNDITWKIGHPQKLFDYLACGLPVIANDVDSWWTKMIKKEKIGLVSEDDPKKFAECIDLLLSDDELWMTMHKNALNLIKTKYNWPTSVKENLIPFLSNVSKK